MERVLTAGGYVEAGASGVGEPVLLIHGAIFGDAFAPLLTHPSLAGYRLLSYHRPGFLGSARASRPFSIADEAAVAAAVLRHFGAGSAHIVGHSFGGAIALQLSLDNPGAAHSLSLLEPALMMVPSAPQFFEAIGPIIAAYKRADPSAAIDGFAQAVGGPNYRAALGKVLPPGWFEQAVADADKFFQVELPALGEWQFSAELAAALTQPVLAVLGADSAPLFVEGHELLKQWLPKAEPFVLPAATHLLQMMNPDGMARALADFFARHPMSVPL